MKKCKRCQRELPSYEGDLCYPCENLRGMRFDGDENDPSDPAFWHKINEMKVGDLAKAILKFIGK